VDDKDQDSPENYWFACYTAIAAANQALDAIKNATDTAAYRAQKGEALVARAYSHFMLVTLFSKVYNPDSASKDIGIPYVTEPENVVMKQYDRKTVAYVYEMIEKDLLAGLPLIDDSKYSVPRYHFNKAAANAFAARFYLFKRDYQKVISNANLAVTGTVAENLRPPKRLADSLQPVWRQAARRYCEKAIGCSGDGASGFADAVADAVQVAAQLHAAWQGVPFDLEVRARAGYDVVIERHGGIVRDVLDTPGRHASLAIAAFRAALQQFRQQRGGNRAVQIVDPRYDDCVGSAHKGDWPSNG